MNGETMIERAARVARWCETAEPNSDPAGAQECLRNAAASLAEMVAQLADISTQRRAARGSDADTAGDSSDG